jgi:hypothetical protein
VYAAFRDPDGEVLVNDFDDALEAWWQLRFRSNFFSSFNLTLD